MAIRPVFVAKQDAIGIDIINVNFEWFPGFSVAQKQRSIASLHEAFLANNPSTGLMEISSKSPCATGVALSAFNLSAPAFLDRNDSFTVETAFQGSKVFSDGGPFTDLVGHDSRSARKDERLRSSGSLIHFEFCGLKFPLLPRTYFYDWLYINVLLENAHLVAELEAFSAFTDIEFNPKRSLNCQAAALALFSSLRANGVDMEQLRDPSTFKQLAYGTIN